MLVARMILGAAAFQRTASLVRQQPFTSPRLVPQQWIYKSYSSQTKMFSTKQQESQPVAVTDGTLIARVLPRKYVEYERLKPTRQRLREVDDWRQRIVWPETIAFEHLQQNDDYTINDDNEIVMLDVQLVTSIFDPAINAFQIIKATLALQRDSTETALRTLRRLELSSQRKLESSKNHMKKSPQRRTSSNTSIVDELSTSILVLEPSSFEDDPEDEEDDVDGYSKLSIGAEIQSKDLWLSMMHLSKTRLWMDVLPEKASGITLDLESCPPTLLYVHNFEDFTADVFVGLPLVLETKVLHADHSLVVWFADDQQVSFDSHCYTPTEADLGKKITVLISPFRQDRPTGYEEVYEFQKTVSERPNLPILSIRSSWLVQKSQQQSRGLRVLSYNLMADIHLSPEVERRAKYAGCNVAVLIRTRRMPLILYEILQHQADIICLQECDATVYEQLLRPTLLAHGFAGFYSNKANSQLEGCAMFWSLSTFEHDAEIEQYPIRDLFKEPATMDKDWVSMGDIRLFLDQLPDLKEVVEENVGQIVQVAKLRLKSASHNNNNNRSQQYLIVGNTHLFYHPLADHVRLMQTFVICKLLDRWCHKDDGTRHPLIFCGDLNSDPASGAVQLLQHRRVTSNQCETWKNLDTYTWEGGDCYFETEYHDSESTPFCDTDVSTLSQKDDPISAVQPPMIHLPDTFPQLVSAYDPMPEFSNYVVGFAETLDYIFVSQSEKPCWRVRFSAPIPTIAEMQIYPAIPNKDYPSDHVSLACDLEWDDSFMRE